ncbi:helix-turn-helix domain-containing protein [Brevundimonas sp.]|uniref:helix-turn-helix domain-containing protein n=1 Tax=Brevundimonas sp. TaxID=1871086 RepID=UPI0035B134A0
MRDWRAIVGRNVKRHRLARGMTQEQLAFAAELDLTYVGGIERGKRNPSIMVLGRLADALGVSPSTLTLEGVE